MAPGAGTRSLHQTLMSASRELRTKMDVSPVEGKTAKARLHLSKPVSISIVGIFVILLIGAFYFARAFFLPVMLSLLVTLTFSPMVRYLRHRGIPSVISAILIVLAMFAVFGSAA